MISVIIPVYNGERYLLNCVKHFESQIYKDFELIFINDGSVDNSFVKLNEIKKESVLNIKIFTQENKGVSAARNVGLTNSSGDYICFCDVDDIPLDNYLSDLYAAIIKNKSDLVIGKHQLIKNNKKLPIKQLNTATYVDSLTSLKQFLIGKIKTGCCTIIVKNEIISAHKLQFAEGYKYSEDIHMIWRLLAFSKQIVLLDKVIYMYELNDSSATAKFNNERLHGFQLMKQLEPFFESNCKDFYRFYKQFGAAKLMWSITWQAATNMGLNEFKDFCDKNSVKAELIKLYQFPNYKVALSSRLFAISKPLFRKCAIGFGKKNIH